MKRHIQKKWVLDRFLEKESQREDLDQQVKDMKEYFGISKVEHQSKDLPVGWKNKIEDTTVTSQKTRTQIRERGKQELWLLWKKQEHILRAETAQHTENSVESVASAIIMHHVAESELHIKMDLRGLREGESREQQWPRR